MKLRGANLQVYEKKLFHISTFMNFAFIFQERIKNASLLLQNRLWKCESKISFRKYKQKVVLFVIYLFNYNSSNSSSFMLNVVFDVALSTVFVK